MDFETIILTSLAIALFIAMFGGCLYDSIPTKKHKSANNYGGESPNNKNMNPNDNILFK